MAFIPIALLAGFAPAVAFTSVDQGSFVVVKREHPLPVRKMTMGLRCRSWAMPNRRRGAALRLCSSLGNVVLNLARR